MKKYLWVFTLSIWIFAACTPQPTQQSTPSNPTSYPNDSYPNSSYPNGDNASPQSSVDLTPAESAAVAALSKITGLPADQVSLVSSETVDWPNGCLGVQKIGVMCTQMIVPGYRIVLQANSALYEFHTNKDGRQVIAVGEVTPAGTDEKIVIKQLASNLNLKESDISVVNTSEIEFPDSCLGVAMNDVMCSQIVTPGKIIVLEVDGIQYEYHITNNGTRIQPATLALTWTRNGGIAGFCDSLTVFLSGEVYGSQCKPQSNGNMGTFANFLSADERGQFNTWVKEFGQANLDASDPKGVSDRMEVTLVFYGTGSGALKKPDEKELFLLAQTLFQKLYK